MHGRRRPKCSSYRLQGICLTYLVNVIPFTNKDKVNFTPCVVPIWGCGYVSLATMMFWESLPICVRLGTSNGNVGASSIKFRHRVLFTPWTMKLSQGPVKKCDWLLNLSWDHFGLHQRKKYQNDRGVQGPHKTYSNAYTIH
jgi:hypothetical protein